MYFRSFSDFLHVFSDKMEKKFAEKEMLTIFAIPNEK